MIINRHARVGLLKLSGKRILITWERQNEKGFKSNDLKPFLFFVPHIRELSNQEKEELSLIYKLRPMMCLIKNAFL